jgi:hypothetical protein
MIYDKSMTLMVDIKVRVIAVEQLGWQFASKWRMCIDECLVDLAREKPLESTHRLIDVAVQELMWNTVAIRLSGFSDLRGAVWWHDWRNHSNGAEQCD